MFSRMKINCPSFDNSGWHMALIPEVGIFKPFKTLENIASDEFGDPGNPQSIKLDLDQKRKDGKLEILYYHPGNITPEEFFHRMFITVHQLKKENDNITVLFNSLDQLKSRFPLCAQQNIFIPGIIEFLNGEGATSIFIAVDEPGQPAEQYGLLPMSDLILSFYPRRFKFKDYLSHINEQREKEGKGKKPSIENEAHSQKGFSYVAKFDRKYVEEVVVQVVRFAGGQRAGAQGLLELVREEEPDIFERGTGLIFTPLSDKYSQGVPVIRNLSGISFLINGIND